MVIWPPWSEQLSTSPAIKSSSIDKSWYLAQNWCHMSDALLFEFHGLSSPAMHRSPWLSSGTSPQPLTRPHYFFTERAMRCLNAVQLLLWHRVRCADSPESATLNTSDSSCNYIQGRESLSPMIFIWQLQNTWIWGKTYVCHVQHLSKPVWGFCWQFNKSES